MLALDNLFAVIHKMLTFVDIFGIGADLLSVSQGICPLLPFRGHCGKPRTAEQCSFGGRRSSQHLSSASAISSSQRIKQLVDVCVPRHC